MSRTLSIRTRQRLRRINLSLLRRLTIHVLERQLRVTRFELAIHLVAADEMARVNETFLKHPGSTDVITFDHADEMGPASVSPRTENRLAGQERGASIHKNLPSRESLESDLALHGELFICLDEAVKQASVFGATWQAELVRYVIHGLLHLCGYDDRDPAARRRMKRAENRLLRETTKRFPPAKLERRNPKRGARKPAL
jgi:probable rRNA maturation factor